MKKILLIVSLSLLPLSLSASGDISTTVRVHYEGTLVFQGPVSLTVGTETSLTDSDGGNHTIPTESALAALSIADASETFSISELMYFSSFGALYVNCIDTSTPERHACAEWMYEVNRQAPSVGMDSYTLSDGDILDVYFGSITPDAPAATTDAPGTRREPQIVEIITIMPVPEPIVEEPLPEKIETDEPEPELETKSAVEIVQFHMTQEEFLKNYIVALQNEINRSYVYAVQKTVIQEVATEEDTSPINQTASVVMADKPLSWMDKLATKISRLFILNK